MWPSNRALLFNLSPYIMQSKGQETQAAKPLAIPLITLPKVCLSLPFGLALSHFVALSLTNLVTGAKALRFDRPDAALKAPLFHILLTYRASNQHSVACRFFMPAATPAKSPPRALAATAIHGDIFLQMTNCA